MNRPVTNDTLQASIEDVEFLARSTHRDSVLNLLSEGPLDRTALRSATGASSPTMGRILSDFRERRWVFRDGATYELTRLGAFVTTRFAELCAAMTTERKLRDVWQWLPQEMEGFSVELFADAVVSYPGPGYPYEPVDRVTELIKQSEEVRGFGTLELKAGSIETICGAVLDGMEMEYIFPPEILETTFSRDAELIMETAASENCTIFVHDALPDEDRCGLSIVDGRMAICCHDTDTQALTAVIDTDAPAARSWALSVFEQCRQEATPLKSDAVDTLVPSDLMV